MKQIKIITDSACDLDIDYIKKLNVHMIPLIVNFGDDVYRDRVTITTNEFYDKLKTFKGLPTTSQIAPAAFVEEFKRYLDEGYHIIYIAFSSRLSGTYQSACIAKNMLETDDITIMDSKGASVGFGLMVREAAIMVKEGKDHKEIEERITYMRDRMEYIFVVGSLEMLKKGGRISTAQAVMGTILNVKPILQFNDGYIVPYDKVRGEKAAIKKMMDTIKERGYDISNQIVGLNYSEDDSLCMQIKDEIQREFGVKEFIISEIGGAIGSHVGGGTTSLFFLKK